MIKSLTDYFKTKDKFILIAGPCSIVNKNICQEILDDIFNAIKPFEKDLIFIFKASYDKANRTSISSYRGIGIDKSLEIFSDLKKEFKISILSDVHCKNEIDLVKDIIDVLQIPAFLCRQTDLIIKSALTKKPINIKKGQFISPKEIHFILEKIKSTGNYQHIITERGTFFGYHQLINDFRIFPLLKKHTTIIYDITHSLQNPGNPDTHFFNYKDKRSLIPYLSKAAIASGAHGIYLETYPPSYFSKSDSDTILNSKKLSYILSQAIQSFQFFKKI